MFQARLQRVRVLDALDRLVKSFRTREDLHPLRVPHEPLSLDQVVDEALGGEARRFDLRTLRARTILALEWDDHSAWDLWVIVLPSRAKAFCDTGDDESRILASGGRNDGDASDRLLLELFAASRGETFGVEMGGGVPCRVRSSVADRAFLVDVFVDLFEGTEQEATISRDWRGTAPGRGHDFRSDVDRWLAAAGIAAPPAIT